MRKTERADLAPGTMYYLADPDVPEEEVPDHQATLVAWFVHDVPSGSPLFHLKGDPPNFNSEYSEESHAFWQIPQVIPEDD